MSGTIDLYLDWIDHSPGNDVFSYTPEMASSGTPETVIYGTIYDKLTLIILLINNLPETLNSVSGIFQKWPVLVYQKWSFLVLYDK